jgi:Uridine kinase
MKTMVIAVSGYSGAGKSTVVSHLSRAFNCSALYFDDYASRDDFPSDISAWIREGGDPNEISTPLFQHHLIQLISGESIELVKGNGWAKEYGINHSDKEVKLIKPSPILIIEEPFGRERQEVKELIDFVVYLDLEPELALGRRVYDLIQYLRNDSEVLISLLDHFLFDYLNRGVRDMYVEIGKKVKANSDLVVNANRNVEEIVSEISKLIRKKRGF